MCAFRFAWQARRSRRLFQTLCCVSTSSLESLSLYLLLGRSSPRWELSSWIPVVGAGACAALGPGSSDFS